MTHNEPVRCKKKRKKRDFERFVIQQPADCGRLAQRGTKVVLQVCMCVHVTAVGQRASFKSVSGYEKRYFFNLVPDIFRWMENLNIC